MVELARNNERKLELAGGGEGGVCGQYCHQCPLSPADLFWRKMKTLRMESFEVVILHVYDLNTMYRFICFFFNFYGSP